MFNTTIVETALLGIVGFKQPNNPDYAIVDAANLLSTSGYFVNDIALAKIEYFKESQDYIEISDANFNELLRTAQKSSITSICNQVFNTEDFRDRNAFYRHANNNVDAEILTDGFVGWKLEVTREKNVAFEITRVILDYQGNLPNNIDLQLFNTGDPNPIHTETLVITEQHQEVELNWEVDNSGDTYKGDYYLGYVKSASTPIPFKRNYNNSNIISEIDSLRITPIEVTGHTGASLFDLDDIDGLSDNIGINPDIIVYDDYTDFIKRNKRLFGRAIQLDMAVRIMDTVATSLRVNRDQNIADGIQVRILQNLNGVDAEGGKLKVLSLRGQLLGEISMIKSEIEKLRQGYFGGRIMVATKI